MKLGDDEPERKNRGRGVSGIGEERGTGRGRLRHRNELAVDRDGVARRPRVVDVPGVDAQLGQPAELSRAERIFGGQFPGVFCGVKEGDVRMLQRGRELQKPVGDVKIFAEDLETNLFIQQLQSFKTSKCRGAVARASFKRSRVGATLMTWVQILAAA